MRRWLALLVVAIPAAVVAMLWTSPPSQAQPIPKSGLSVVTHDTSLAGSGTLAAPLGLRADCDSAEVLAWDGDSWECGGGGGACVAIAGACTQNSDCCTGNCDEGGGTCEAEGGVVAGTNIDVSGSTVSVEPTVDLAGESEATTLSILGTGTGQTADGRKLTSISDSGMTFLGENGSPANSYGLHISRTASCSDCTTGNNEDHNNIAAYFSANGDESGDNAVNNYSLVADKGAVILAADPDDYVNIGGYVNMNPDSAIVVETISSWASIGSFSSQGGGAGFPGGSSYSYGTPSGNLNLIAAGNGTTGGGTLTLNATGDGAIVIGSDSDDTLTVNATTTHAAPTTVQDLRGTQIDVTASGTLTDWSPTGLSTATVLRVNFSGSTDVVSIAGGSAGRILTIINIGSFTPRFFHEYTTGTTAAMRIALDATYSYLAQGAALTLEYDATSSRWRQIENSSFYTYRLTTVNNLTADGSFEALTNAVNTYQPFTTTVTANLGNGDADVTNIRMPKDDGTAASLSSCGSSPTISGGSWAFRITAGTGGITACTATFAQTKTNTPICTAQIQNSTERVYLSSVSATAITITAASGTTDISGDTITVTCFGDG